MKKNKRTKKTFLAKIFEALEKGNLERFYRLFQANENKLLELTNFFEQQKKAQAL
jgi:succinate dehydrogenase flavin-adding protein (antitoxin of CptAB toxin-antitoxin module)